MNSDKCYIIDKSSKSSIRSSVLQYTRSGNIEDLIDDDQSKPSQERPAILKQKAKRYHESGNEKRFTPGKMSYTLRKALGLGLSDIPEHIYRMRQLGYPPGWLKKAEVNTENISITGENAIVNISNNESVKYDWDKLYAFPGFNTLRNYERKHDRYRERGFMAMQENSLLENFQKFLSEKQMLGKEATNMKDIRSREVIDTNTDFNLPIATSTPTKSTRRLKRSNAVDLSDGEVEDDEDDSSLMEYESEKAESGICFHVDKTESGTVLLVPSLTKPALDRFSEGINDHRLFENLPNVGGTYKKVLGVLKRIQP